MKFRAHETFALRKGWVNKGLSAVTETPALFVDKNINPMDVLGIGSNMVKSLRYWLQATGLTQEGVKGQRGQVLTSLGKIIIEHDPYLEELGTLCLLHYQLAKGIELSTAWYYFFNVFSLKSFEKDDFVTAVDNWCKLKGLSVNTRSLDDDFNCIINTYLPRYKTAPGRSDPESNMECPLSELSLLDIGTCKGKYYYKTAPVRNSIDPMIALAIIVDKANGRKEVLISELLNGDCSLGKIFNLDIISLMELLDSVQETGDIKVIRTAGMDVIRIDTDSGYLDCIAQYYENLF